MPFKQLLSHPEILKAIEEAGYTQPTPIQQQAIPEAIEGSDLLASAQTGTGKTAAFVLPCLERIATRPSLSGKGPRVLILVPTRELAMQVAAETNKYSKYLAKTKTVCIYGGTPYPQQNRDLSRPYEILVATPGRLIDHMQRGRVSLERVELFVLDEADRMLDMGFIPAVEEIAEATPSTRQTLFFSATLKGNVLRLAKQLLKDPVTVSVEPEKIEQSHIEQRLHGVKNLDHKYRLLKEILSDEAIDQAIVFTSTKYQADTLVDQLLDNGERAAALHGDMRQRQRTKTMQEMRQGKIRVLVATDVAARGIDLPTITHVINFDLPRCTEDYVHRIGRTGRAGASGIALSFATSKELSLVRQIERFTGQKILFHPSTEGSFFSPEASPQKKHHPQRNSAQKRGPFPKKPFFSSFKNKKRRFPRSDRSS